MANVQLNNGVFEDLGKLNSKKKQKINNRTIYVYIFENGEIASAQKL